MPLQVPRRVFFRKLCYGSYYLRLLIEGLTYKGIAEKLFISPDTVKTHISRLYRKTKSTGKTDFKYTIRMFQQ